MKISIPVIMRFLAQGDKTWADVTYEEQKGILESFPAPHDDVERSFFQYKCQNVFRGEGKILLYNFISLLLLAPVLSLLFVKGLVIRKKDTYSIIGEFKGFDDIIPRDFVNKPINNNVWLRHYSLSYFDFSIIKVLFFHRYFFSPYFVLKLVLKISGYSYMIESYSPSIILTHNEYSFTSSFLTMYCEKRGVEHINAMHGEKLYYIRDAFFRYSKCYVWDEYYRQLFISLRCKDNQFVISCPRSLVFNPLFCYNESHYSRYKYFLQDYNYDKLMSIINSVSMLGLNNEKLRFRPHPRFSDINLLRRHVPENMIEYPDKVPISESIASCDFVIGYYSTVLFQGFKVGKTVIINDVAYSAEYEQLKDHKYILCGNPTVKRLSEWKETN